MCPVGHKDCLIDLKSVYIWPMGIIFVAVIIAVV